MKKNLIFLILFTFLISDFAQNKEYVLTQNISYYESSTNKPDRYQTEKCVLDIYYPKDMKDFSTVVWFHGGGLTGGGKEIPEALKNKGICVIGVGYRLSPNVVCPKYIEDAAAAVAWTFRHIQSYGGDPARIFVSGHSAGGYLTLMIGMDKKWLNFYGIDANKIAGLIPFSGQTITHFTIRKERGIAETQPVVDEFAPLFYVRKDIPPLLLITGDREMELLGRYEENAYLMRMMKVAGHQKTVLFELDGYDHGGMAEPAFPLLLKNVEKISKAIG